jgi:hypothetical protein
MKVHDLVPAIVHGLRTVGNRHHEQHDEGGKQHVAESRTCSHGQMVARRDDHLLNAAGRLAA